MSNLAKKKDTQIEVLQALEENKIDLNDEEYPFNQTLGELNSQIKNIEERYSEYLTTKEGINTKLQDLTSLTSKLNLTLSSNQKRGNWGEIQAEKILEDGGLVKGQHFKTQEILETGGKPDITLNLPNEKVLHLDVKFPLQNYISYLGVVDKINNTIEENEISILEDKSKEYYFNTLNFKFQTLPTDQTTWSHGGSGSISSPFNILDLTMSDSNLCKISPMTFSSKEPSPSSPESLAPIFSIVSA